MTTFERWNLVARRWEIAGEVHWVNNFNGQVQFGINIVSRPESVSAATGNSPDFRCNWVKSADGGGREDCRSLPHLDCS